MLQVAAYCRVSTDKEDQANSFEAQQRYFREYIQRQPDWELQGIYADEGFSGTSTNKRVEFNKMLHAAELGQIDLIVTKEVSRFTRNTVDALQITRELRRRGVGVLFLNDSLDTRTNDGELRLTIMSSFAQDESRRTSERSKWGQMRSMEKGVVFGGSLLGYDVIGGKMTVNPEGAEVVRLIFHKYLQERKGCSTIARELREAGILSSKGNCLWSSATVTKILKNEKYCGDCLLQKAFIANPITHQQVRNNGKLPKYLVEDCLPAIVDKETWKLAQAVAARHTSHRQAPNERYPFTGKLFCGVCGKPYYYYHYTTTNKKPLAAYRCMSHKTQSAVEVAGQTYTPPHKATFNRNASAKLIAYRERYCKPPKERPMLCTDVRIPIDLPQKTFCRAWNLIVAKKLRYQATLRSTVDNAEDILVRYRAEEMCLLIDEIGKITEFSYPLMLKTLDRVVVNTNGKLSFIFQSGIKITV